LVAVAVSVAAVAGSPVAVASAAAAPPSVGATAAQPRHPVYLIYDGFIANPDGSLTLAFGYYNVNRVEVSVAGDDNVFLPGAADRGQPTVFLPGRQRFACVMVVPETFGGRLQWQVRFAGHESVTTARILDPLYALEEASARESVEGIEVDGAPQEVCLERNPANQLQ
jgi:hypothetical protein